MKQQVQRVSKTPTRFLTATRKDRRCSPAKAIFGWVSEYLDQPAPKMPVFPKTWFSLLGE
jgi:hypothetical protein